MNIERVKQKGEKKSEEDRLEQSKYSLDLVNTWISSADTKVSICSGVLSVVVAAVVFCANLIMGWVNVDDTPIIGLVKISRVCSILGVISFSVSLIFFFLAIIPRLTSSKDAEDKKFSLFFGDISSFGDENEFIETAMSISIDDYSKEVLRETYINSQICTRKMSLFKKGTIASIATVVNVIVAAITYPMAYWL